MYDSAVYKLTAWYVAALFVIVLLFSLPTLNFASSRLQKASDRQGNLVIEYISPPYSNRQNPDMRERRQLLVQEEQNNLVKEIIVTDLFILLVGAVLSFFFARHTLRPLEEAHEAQSRFTADASHELRTPLATMQSEIEVALRDKKPTIPDLKNTLTSNLEEIARLRNLSDQLLMLTKIDNEQITKNKFSLSKIIEKRISDLEKQYGITVSQNIAKNISIFGDEHLIAEVLTILADNAVRYADKDNPIITVSLTKKGNSAELIVADNGEGISEQDLPYIFDRFYRGSKSSKNGGHGLGLALADEIIAKHRGTIDAVNQKGSGAKFTIVFDAA